MSSPITFNEFIQPVNLTNICEIPHLGGQAVIAAGMGMDDFTTSKNRDQFRLRQASFVTMSSELDKCTALPDDNQVDANTVICAKPNEHQQSIYYGDSGNIICSRTTTKLWKLIY